MSRQPSTDSANLSKAQLFARLPDNERQKLLEQLSPQAQASLAYEWENWHARPNQLPPDSDWRFWLVMAGRGFGKTRIGAEEIRKASRRVQYPNMIGATADDARDIMIEGESGILAVCPPWERPTYRASKRLLEWPSGAKSLIFTADEPERLRGKQHEWLWADEVAAWRYPEAWDQAMLGLRLGKNPQAVITTTPKPTKLVRDLIASPYTVVTRGSTYDNLDNLAEAFADEIIRKYEGTRLGKQELEGELLEDEGLAYRLDEKAHVIKPFLIPADWMRFESFDYGWTNPSAVLAYATDPSGNLIVFDGLYHAGLPSEIAPLIQRKRRQWWEAGGRKNVVWSDPSIWNKSPTSRFDRPTSAADEFTERGITLSRANPDRRAGYIRICELLKLDAGWRYPDYHDDRGKNGSPRVFIFDVKGTAPLREQLAEAPLEEADPGPNQGRFPGGAVAAKWEGPFGHAHASFRYGVMSRPSPSTLPKQPLPDPRSEFLRQVNERERKTTRRPAVKRRYTNI